MMILRKWLHGGRRHLRTGMGNTNRAPHPAPLIGILMMEMWNRLHGSVALSRLGLSGLVILLLTDTPQVITERFHRTNNHVGSQTWATNLHFSA